MRSNEWCYQEVLAWRVEANRQSHQQAENERQRISTPQKKHVQIIMDAFGARESVNRVLKQEEHGAARSDRCGENEPPPTKTTAGSAPVSCWFPSCCFVPCGQHMISDHLFSRLRLDSLTHPLLFALTSPSSVCRDEALAYYNALLSFLDSPLLN